MRTAQEAVHSNLEESRAVYNFVFDLCVKLGAKPDDLVPFEKYAAAAQSLTRPASAARALQNGAPNIERADKLVQLIARQKGMSNAGDRCAGGAGRCAARRQSQKGGGLDRLRPRESAPPAGGRFSFVRKLSGLRGYGGLWTKGRFGRPCTRQLPFWPRIL